ncbi:TolC family protein [Thauera linaloolentis]|uniref:Outer membrane efflux protein n=1 Tax=Thauera linaloolentis (strain DSM 12138 / JCM 21573 / CCUG 41526 / CIP 105981 / IAM 15112 / NBRC 102519 / 47Lol) TaxID=1123367 RepID=N6Y8P1_THAL4|nr:TolC family protein [Thauera linaloolentis]ENO87890.1 outer membrane efflux protein [Thauera linaloolentis 47Lol = DSM 12138]MCM8567576.1 TolC family protein [Thauera linaloolentis]
MLQRKRITWAAGLLLGLAAGSAWCQPTGGGGPLTLERAFEAAWARQPEALSFDAQQAAAQARRESAGNWLAEPPSLELAGKTDRFDGNHGSREYEIGLALPIWLPGERGGTADLAMAEMAAGESRAQAARLRTAAAVRAAYWDWQRTLIEAELGRERLGNARELVADVARRVKVGELARADQHQAEGALATAEAAAAEAGNAQAEAAQQLRALTGLAPAFDAGRIPPAEADPGGAAVAVAADAGHPAVVELRDRAEVARRAMALASIQGRANPELSLATTRERGASGEDWEQTVTLALRIPFGAGSRHQARVASANAEAIEAEAQFRLERERVLADTDLAQVRVESARTQLAAAERRAQLAKESRGFFQQAFRLGEADLPTRLRIELEAAEAERQLARARIDLAAAISTLRQALGLLPQ